MAIKWKHKDIKDGIGEFSLTSWNYFSDFIDKEMLDFRSYIYRGHKEEKWLLEPTFNRIVDEVENEELDRMRTVHLDNFRYAIRGRVQDSNRYTDENELWALGQHNGLATPLLDWTTSPYVAAYFALFEPGPKSGFRIVYSINKDLVESIDNLEIVNPITDENTRLINQSGLFVNVSTAQDLESLFRENFKGVDNEYAMIKIRIPCKHREIALRSLNRMNINHNTLFPDIQGASIYCNTDITIKDY